MTAQDMTVWGIIARERLTLETLHIENAQLMLQLTLTFDHKFPCDDTVGCLKPMHCCQIGGRNPCNIRLWEEFPTESALSCSLQFKIGPAG